MNWAGMAAARGAPPRAAPNIMSVTARTDVILNICNYLKFPLVCGCSGTPRGGRASTVGAVP
jgi:hypothetical protein